LAPTLHSVCAATHMVFVLTATRRSSPLLHQARGIDQHIRNYGTGQIYVYELDKEGVTDPARYPVVYHTVDTVGGKWVEQVILRAPDVKVGDRFGTSIAVHQAQIIVGAPGASAQVRALLCPAVLCCPVLSCVVLPCAVLCCPVLCCALLCPAVLSCLVLSCAVLCCVVPCCAVLCCVVLCPAVLSCPVLSCPVLCPAVLSCPVLCCPVLCCALLCCVRQCWAVQRHLGVTVFLRWCDQSLSCGLLSLVDGNFPPPFLFPPSPTPAAACVCV
jgi:hypothetical protein